MHNNGSPKKTKTAMIHRQKKISSGYNVWEEGTDPYFNPQFQNLYGLKILTFKNKRLKLVEFLRNNL